MKGRLTVSLDQDLIDAAEAAVAEGRAASVSAWVAEAMASKAEKESRLEALRDALQMWESEFGPLTEADRAETDRRFHETAILVKDGKVHVPPHRLQGT